MLIKLDMIMRPVVLFSLFIIFTFSSVAQIPERSYVKQEEGVERLMELYRQHNRTEGMQGFRVQIYTASGNRSKLLTEREKATFDAAFPEMRSYITYDEPYYKLRVGDFRSRIDAEKFLREISPRYLGSMVVTDKINFPRLNTPDSSSGIIE
jgi:hypothetical protein